MRRAGMVGLGVAVAALGGGFAWGWPSAEPAAETAAVYGRGDTADDAAVWIHPTEPGLSMIIGMSKSAEGGIATFSPDGELIQFVSFGKAAFVDVRYGFSLGEGEADLAASADRNEDTLRIFRVDAGTRGLIEISGGGIPVEMNVYGGCLYHSWMTDRYFVFLTDKRGRIEQWEILEDGAGGAGAVKVRELEVGGVAEGCAADDEYGVFYAAEENVGVWRFDAEPTGGTVGTMVDFVGGRGHLAADVEGLAIYDDGQGGGYLLASCQGESRFAVYERGGENRYVESFRIAANAEAGIDGCEATDGIEVTAAALGAAFPEGVLVAHDGRNRGGMNSNYKLVAWERVREAIEYAGKEGELFAEKVKITTGKAGEAATGAFRIEGTFLHLGEAELEREESLGIYLQNPEGTESYFGQEVELSQGRFGRHGYRYAGKGPGITRLQFDFAKNRFSVRAKKVDLTGLERPFRVSFFIGGREVSGIVVMEP